MAEGEISQVLETEDDSEDKETLVILDDSGPEEMENTNLEEKLASEEQNDDDENFDDFQVLDECVEDDEIEEPEQQSSASLYDGDILDIAVPDDATLEDSFINPPTEPKSPPLEKKEEVESALLKRVDSQKAIIAEDKVDRGQETKEKPQSETVKQKDASSSSGKDGATTAKKSSTVSIASEKDQSVRSAEKKSRPTERSPAKEKEVSATQVKPSKPKKEEQPSRKESERSKPPSAAKERSGGSKHQPSESTTKKEPDRQQRKRSPAKEKQASPTKEKQSHSPNASRKEDQSTRKEPERSKAPSTPKEHSEGSKSQSSESTKKAPHRQESEQAPAKEKQAPAKEKQAPATQTKPSSPKNASGQPSSDGSTRKVGDRSKPPSTTKEQPESSKPLPSKSPTEKAPDSQQSGQAAAKEKQASTTQAKPSQPKSASGKEDQSASGSTRKEPERSKPPSTPKVQSEGLPSESPTGKAPERQQSRQAQPPGNGTGQPAEASAMAKTTCAAAAAGKDASGVTECSGGLKKEKEQPARKEPVHQVKAYIDSILNLEYDVKVYCCFYCVACPLLLPTTQRYEEHLSSSLHKQNVALWRISQDLQGEELKSQAKRQLDVDNFSETIVGADQVVEVCNTAGVPCNFICVMCSSFLVDVDALLNHLTSFLHIENYMEKIDRDIFKPPAISCSQFESMTVAARQDDPGHVANVHASARSHMMRKGRGCMRSYVGDRYQEINCGLFTELEEMEETLMMSLLEQLFAGDGSYKAKWQRVDVGKSVGNEIYEKQPDDIQERIVGLQTIVEIWFPNRRMPPVFYCSVCNYMVTNVINHCSVSKHWIEYFNKCYKSILECLMLEADDEQMLKELLVTAVNKVLQMEGKSGRIKEVIQIMVDAGVAFCAVNALIAQQIVDEMGLKVTVPKPVHPSPKQPPAPAISSSPSTKKESDKAKPIPASTARTTEKKNDVSTPSIGQKSMDSKPAAAASQMHQAERNVKPNVKGPGPSPAANRDETRTGVANQFDAAKAAVRKAKQAGTRVRAAPIKRNQPRSNSGDRRRPEHNSPGRKRFRSRSPSPRARWSGGGMRERPAEDRPRVALPRGNTARRIVPENRPAGNRQQSARAAPSNRRGRPRTPSPRPQMRRSSGSAELQERRRVSGEKRKRPVTPPISSSTRRHSDQHEKHADAFGHSSSVGRHGGEDLRRLTQVLRTYVGLDYRRDLTEEDLDGLRARLPPGTLDDLLELLLRAPTMSFHQFFADRCSSNVVPLQSGGDWSMASAGGERGTANAAFQGGIRSDKGEMAERRQAFGEHVFGQSQQAERRNRKDDRPYSQQHRHFLGPETSGQIGAMRGPDRLPAGLDSGPFVEPMRPSMAKMDFVPSGVPTAYSVIQSYENPAARGHGMGNEGVVYAQPLMNLVPDQLFVAPHPTQTHPDAFFGHARRPDPTAVSYGIPIHSANNNPVFMPVTPNTANPPPDFWHNHPPPTRRGNNREGARKW